MQLLGGPHRMHGQWHAAFHEPAPAVRGADKDRDDIQHQTELQERALDGIDSALDDLGVMSQVPPAPPQPTACLPRIQP